MILLTFTEQNLGQQQMQLDLDVQEIKAIPMFGHKIMLNLQKNSNNFLMI